MLKTKPTSQKYPVDICYMVADLKYSVKSGVKICEIQQASLSMFNGDAFRNEQEESIHNQLAKKLSKYNKRGWVVTDTMADIKLVKTLAANPGWTNPKDLIGLFSDRSFISASKSNPKDIYDLKSYSGLLYINWSLLSVIYDFEERLPGVVAVDKSTFPFWADKKRQTELFQKDKLLSKLKPNWGSYKKRYTKTLAEKIANDLNCETFVIKPRGNFLGKGVIIINKPELDEVLRYIITKKGKLAGSKDSSYTAWKHDSFDSFIVEEFVTSDPIQVPHLENKTYQPTMRVAFLLTYNQQKHGVDFLGGYWKTPAVAIDEEGDFMQKNKDICKPPYYSSVDSKTMKAVQTQLRQSLPLLHKKMLEFRPASDEQFYTSYGKPKVQISLQPIV